MYEATITIPQNGRFPETTHDGLSDDIALSSGRQAAHTLSDDQVVVVRLTSGEVITIGRNSETGHLTYDSQGIIGTLELGADNVHRTLDAGMRKAFTVLSDGIEAALASE